ncbi:MAG: HEPN domain-containing protein [Nanoarchaeota archaeon]
MLDQKRIKEAQTNVKSYLSEGLIYKQDFQDIVFSVLTNNAKESLETADFLFKNGKSKLWVIVASYYSMFYMGNAVLYKIGYKVGEKIPHKVTSDALIVYVKDRLKESLIENYEELKEEALLIAGNKAEDLIGNFDYERKKRSSIQYQTKGPELSSKAETSLKRAKEFLFEIEKLISSFNGEE